MSLKPVYFVPENSKDESEVKKEDAGMSSSDFYERLLGIKSGTEPEPQQHITGTDGTDEVKKTYKCQECDFDIPSDERQEHLKSIGHMIAVGNRNEKPTIYSINPSNVGFQLMQRSGWDIGVGLGKEEQGRKYPVSSVQRLDRSGLGRKSKTRKLTNNLDEVEKNKQLAEAMKKKAKTKKEINKEAHDDRAYRHNLLTYMNRQTDST